MTITDVANIAVAEILNMGVMVLIVIILLAILEFLFKQIINLFKK
jgi:hypothetical protein